jgi:hypothetical protein
MRSSTPELWRRNKGYGLEGDQIERARRSAAFAMLS